MECPKIELGFQPSIQRGTTNMEQWEKEEGEIKTPFILLITNKRPEARRFFLNIFTYSYCVRS